MRQKDIFQSAHGLRNNSFSDQKPTSFHEYLTVHVHRLCPYLLSIPRPAPWMSWEWVASTIQFVSRSCGCTEDSTRISLPSPLNTVWPRCNLCCLLSFTRNAVTLRRVWVGSSMRTWPCQKVNENNNRKDVGFTTLVLKCAVYSFLFRTFPSEIPICFFFRLDVVSLGCVFTSLVRKVYFLIFLFSLVADLFCMSLFFFVFLKSVLVSHF